MYFVIGQLCRVSLAPIQLEPTGISDMLCVLSFAPGAFDSHVIMKFMKLHALFGIFKCCLCPDPRKLRAAADSNKARPLNSACLVPLLFVLWLLSWHATYEYEVSLASHFDGWGHWLAYGIFPALGASNFFLQIG